MNNIKKLSILFSILFILQGCSVTSTDKVVKPGEAKSGFLGLSKTADVTVQNEKALKQQSSEKVIIGSFKVGFIVDGKASAVAKGGYFSPSSSYGKAAAIVHLKGVTSEQMQQITNDIYNNFVEELKGKGYTVVTAADLANEPAYQALQDAGVTEPQEGIVSNLAQEGKTSYFAPEGTNVIYYLGERKATFDISMDTINKTQALSDATSTPVIAVNYLANFAGANSHGGFTSTASVQVGQVAKFIAGSTVTYYFGKKFAPAYVRLGQAVWSEEKFADIENITSSAAKTVRTVTNVASAILGGGTTQVEEYNFNVDAEGFRKAMKDVGERTNKAIIEKVAAVQGK